jgi:hypothetical protein
MGRWVRRWTPGNRYVCDDLTKLVLKLPAP